MGSWLEYRGPAWWWWWWWWFRFRKAITPVKVLCRDRLPIYTKERMNNYQKWIQPHLKTSLRQILASEQPMSSFPALSSIILCFLHDFALQLSIRVCHKGN